ncbi:HD domain-containing protein [Methanocaldococcus sp. 28A]
MYIVSKYFPSNNVKLIRDPIYKFIEVPYEFVQVIDIKYLQRLRWVSQLPLEQLVYPSAQHSRFEHSIGTMYLSMLIAITLLNDDISKERIYNAIDDDPNTENLKSDEMKNQFFVASAGLIGLLHDVGHAPFSHTLEDSLNYTKKDLNYNHERVGFEIAKHIIRECYLSGPDSGDYKKVKEAVANTVLRVLNKDYKIEDLTFLQKILRSIIDSSLDVDKGDYLLRDSYHCGVMYGYYDLERLWRNVRISEDFTLGVSPKGAIETWSLRIARYKMYKNVYTHHVRNITDAMLIRILSEAFDKLDEEDIKKILPIDDDSSKRLTDEILLNFSFWTDNLFLKEILELEDNKYKDLNVKFWIENFLKRSLPKRYYELKLEEFGILKYDKQLFLKIKEELESINPEFTFIIFKNMLPPVFTRDVQADIKVITDNKEEQTLAEYLEFKIHENDLDKCIESSSMLEIFAFRPTEEDYKEQIKNKLEKIAKEYT